MTPSKPTLKTSEAPDGVLLLRAVLKTAEPRPTVADTESKKIKYAVRFAEHMANRIAADLSPRLKNISATTKRTAGSVRGSKQLDVNFSTPQLGLALGISLKSVHLRDVKGAQRYTHNMKGVLFLPFDSCQDGKKGNPSSFGSWVRHLRPFSGRDEPENDIDQFEKIYIGLYEPTGTDLQFFDVDNDPPKNSRPTVTVSYARFLDAVYHEYLRRNAADFRWAEGDEAPLDLTAEDDEDDQT